MLITDALAQGAGSKQNVFGAFLPLILVFAIFYFLVIAPQRKKQKTHETRVNALTRGSRIVTGGGFYATVQRVVDHRLEIVLDGDKTVAVVGKASVSQVLDEEQKAPVSAKSGGQSGKKPQKAAAKGALKKKRSS